MIRGRERALVAARRSAERGAFSKARTRLMRWIAKSPADAEAWLVLGDVQRRTGALRDAVGSLGQGARLYVEQGRPREAVKVLEQRLLVLDPDNSWAQLRLAELYAQLGEKRAASVTLRALALRCQRAGRPERARKLLRRSLVLTPTDAASRVCLAEQCSGESRLDQAVAHFALAAEQLLAEERQEEALLVLERLLFHQPTNTTALREAARVHLASARPRRALVYLDRCLREQPSALAALELLVENFLLLERSERALAVLKEIARRHELAGRVSDRNQAYRRVLVLEPAHPQAIEALGPARIPLESHSEPSTAAQSGLLLREDSFLGDEKSAQLMAELDVYIKYRLWVAARAQLEVAKQRLPNSPELWLLRLQRIHQGTGRGEEESSVLERLLKLERVASSAEAVVLKQRLAWLRPSAAELSRPVSELASEPGSDERVAANTDAEQRPRRVGRGPADGTLRVGVTAAARRRGARRQKEELAQLAVIEEGEAEFARGRAFEERGLYGRAAAAYRAAMHAGYRRAECHRRIGGCCRLTGDLSASVSWLKRGLRVRRLDERERLGLLFGLAESYELMDDQAEALHCYRQVDAVDPRYPGLRDRLASLGELWERSA